MTVKMLIKMMRKCQCGMKMNVQHVTSFCGCVCNQIESSVVLNVEYNILVIFDVEFFFVFVAMVLVYAKSICFDSTPNSILL